MLKKQMVIASWKKFAIDIDEIDEIGKIAKTKLDDEVKMNFIIAQIIGLIILLSLITMYQQKNKKKLLLFAIISNSLTILQYLLLNATTGAFLELVNTLRNVIFYNFEKAEKKPSIIILIIFLIITIAVGIITWQDKFSGIPIIVTIIYTYALWQSDINITRILSVIYAGGIAVYNFIIFAYSGAISAMIVSISIIISIIVDKGLNNRKKLTINN